MRKRPFFLNTTDLKIEARDYRARQAEMGHPVTHSQALEMVARWHGFRDWNTARGVLPVTRTPAFSVGQRVKGHYLKQAFEGTILGVSSLGTGERFRLTVQFDAPVDVVSFDSFSALRQRVVSIVGHNGVSTTRTSDGAPHMELAPMI